MAMTGTPMDQANSDIALSVEMDTTSLRREFAELTRLGNQFAGSLSRAFVGLSMEGRSFGDVLRSLALSLSRMTLAAAFRPLGNMLASLVTAGLPVGALATNRLASRALPVPFAPGGGIASPFGGEMLSTRAAHLAPASFAPIAARSDAMPTGAPAQPVHINFNIATPDAESFRRSESQIAALLARTVAHGHRNL